MFSLIITIVSIALIVAITGATMYYGGDSLTQGRDKANASAIVAAGQQIAGAINMYDAMEDTPLTGEVDEEGLKTALVDEGYLKAIPQVNGTTDGVWEVNADDNQITLTNVNEAVCDAIGDGGIYGCASGTFTLSY